MELGAGSVRPEAGADRALTGRLAAITGARLLFLTLLLGAAAFFYLRGDLAIYPQSLRIIFATIATAYALGAAYAVLLRAGAPPVPLAYAQILLDQVTWTAIVYVTGGATSGATSFYALTCLLGAMLIGLRGATVAALSGIAMYAVLCFAFALHWIQAPHDQTYLLTTSELVYPLLVNALGIGVVALLAGYLAERLRLTGGALEAATRRALHAERLALLGSVAAGLAHEIRNPLGSISGSIEMLRESEHLSEEDRLLCEIVQREAARLNHLVTTMLDLSKPRPPRIEPVDVAALARDVVALAARTERSGAGDVKVLYDGPDDGTYARCDGAQMRQVLWNLVRNAVQASGAGTEVRVVVRAGAGGVELSVEDEGPGIPESAREKIFDAFFTTRAGGTGMGLAVVKRILDDHGPSGASIAVDSPPRGGAVFSVHLPPTTAAERASLNPMRS
jgi:two-component system, NtrC family, sensor histidine kinase HydH